MHSIKLGLHFYIRHIREYKQIVVSFPLLNAAAVMNEFPFGDEIKYNHHHQHKVRFLLLSTTQGQVSIVVDYTRSGFRVVCHN